MTVEQFCRALEVAPAAPVHLMLPGGEFVPAHYHVTEVGRVQKDFIDCGGTVRSSAAGVLQVWVADDTDHRLTAGRLAGIMRSAGPLLKSDQLPVEVEYEGELVSQFPVAGVEQTPSGVLFLLGTKHTDCLAKELCAVPLGVAAGCGAVGCC